MCVIGPSGSGKTTLLRCINFLEPYTAAGSMSMASWSGTARRTASSSPAPERDIANIRAETAMVFQQFNLFPHMTAIQNVAFGPTKVRKIPKKQAEQRARELLERVGLATRPTRIRTNSPAVSNNE